MRAIARALGRAPSTITRQVKANGGRERYRIWPAHQRARACTKRPKTAKLDNSALCETVTSWLEESWSPDEISRRLAREFPDDPTMQVSHETIYQSLYAQGRGELRRELARCLRSGRAKRRSQGFVQTHGKIRDMVMISERTAEVQDRAVPGHWEGDLIIGTNGRSAVVTLVERSTGSGHSCTSARTEVRWPSKTPCERPSRPCPVNSCAASPGIGKEMANHRSFTVATGVPVYFGDPHSSWQRGSNENTNGLLRRYMPEGTDLSKRSAEDLMRIQRSLNGRPRKTLDSMMPAEKLAELVALTA
jgi:IS30 family transposase